MKTTRATVSKYLETSCGPFEAIGRHAEKGTVGAITANRLLQLLECVIRVDVLHDLEAVGHGDRGFWYRHRNSRPITRPRRVGGARR